MSSAATAPASTPRRAGAAAASSAASATCRGRSAPQSATRRKIPQLPIRQCLMHMGNQFRFTGSAAQSRPPGLHNGGTTRFSFAAVRGVVKPRARQEKGKGNGRKENTDQQSGLVPTILPGQSGREVGIVPLERHATAGPVLAQRVDAFPLRLRHHQIGQHDRGAEEMGAGDQGLDRPQAALPVAVTLQVRFLEV